MENHAETMNEMAELDMEDLSLVTGGGPVIRSMLLKMQNKIKTSGRRWWPMYQQWMIEDDDATAEQLMDKLLAVIGLHMKVDYENDTIIFQNRGWTLDDILRIL